MRRHSPYNYAFNNPVYFIDPDGMFPTDSYGMSTATGAVDRIGGYNVRTFDKNGKTIDFKTVSSLDGVGYDSSGTIFTDGGAALQNNFNEQVDAAFGDKADKAAPANKESVNEVVNGVPTLKDMHDGFEGKVNINVNEKLSSEAKDTFGAVAITYPHNGELNGNPHITLYGASFETYRILARTLFHEFIHVQDFRSGQIFNDFIRICGGNLSASQARQSALYLSEIRAYREGLRVTGQPLTSGYSKAANYLTKMGIDF